jgi:SAM-dependent methyltransferase
MSGFSADWLALREPADHRARSPELLACLHELFTEREAIAVVDLGCGTGSNLRACAPHLPSRQIWTLVDHDAALLQTARTRLAEWADASEAFSERLHLAGGGKEIQLRFREADLAKGLGHVLDGPPDLITAAALFDLVSPAWIENFAAEVARRRAVFYTALTYDGFERWHLPHPADAEMLAAFHAHQGRDKGFGPAAGPRATELLATAFRTAGYEVRTAASPWRLGPDDAALARELVDGTAAAARETGQVPEPTIRAWRDARLGSAACEIGHRDLLAVPRRL